ncbi:MAG: hypothetical protein AAGL66_10985, partial [Pseudomonadota bacterium]
QRVLCLFNFSGESATWGIDAPGAMRIFDSACPASGLETPPRGGTPEVGQVRLAPWGWALFVLSPAVATDRP